MKMSQKKKYTWLLVALLLFVFAGLKVWAVMIWSERTGSNVEEQSVSCDLSVSCKLSDGLSIHTSEPINLKNAVDIYLDTEGVAVEKAHVSFTMKDMNMGFNRYDLKMNDEGEYVARNVRLPLCVQNRHDYIMEVHVDQRRYTIPFVAE